MSTSNIASAHSASEEKAIKKFIQYILTRNKGEKEFIQAVQEVAQDIVPFIEDHKKYKEERIFERITEPERIFIFRVPWMDDQGGYQINRGFRIQMNSAIGPYKGGIRLHPSVNLSILKFLAFEQVFKNSLTTLPLGAGKGGSDFDPKGKTNNEVMRFCQSYMTELSKYIGANIDIPAGDIGTGSREIGYMFGQYKRLHNEFVGVLTGKDFSYGGSLIRPEATGYGSVYFANQMLNHRGDSLKGKRCLVSGAGNVAQYTAKKLIYLGAKVITFSDSHGFIYKKDGFTEEEVEGIIQLKTGRRGKLSTFAEENKCEFHADKKPWSVPGDAAFPSATQNEILEEDARGLANNGCLLVCEGANMPSTPDAISIFHQNKILYGPGKAANAGGVAVSGLEMAQNSIRFYWSEEEVDQKLHNIMISIHKKCVEFGKERDDYVNYQKGANIAGFIKVADAMLAQGLV